MKRLLKAGIHFYLLGLAILSLGIGLAVESMLGTSAYDALLVGLFRTFGLSIGSWEIIVGFITVIGNALAEKKRPEYFAFITAIITGIGIDSWLFLLKMVHFNDTLFGKSIYLILSILLTGLGIAFYLQSNIAPNPIDRSMLIIAKFTGWNMTYSRMAINLVFLIMAYFFSGAIGIGTLLNVFFVGTVIGAFTPFTTRLKQSSMTKLANSPKQA